MNRYRPQPKPFALAMLAAVSFTAAMLAGIHAEAEPQYTTAAAHLTGEVTPDGPVIRLPVITVTASRDSAEDRAERRAHLPLGAVPHTLLSASPQS